jgi:hypothetical protein
MSKQLRLELLRIFVVSMAIGDTRRSSAESARGDHACQHRQLDDGALSAIVRNSDARRQTSPEVTQTVLICEHTGSTVLVIKKILRHEESARALFASGMVKRNGGLFDQPRRPRGQHR